MTAAAQNELERLLPDLSAAQMRQVLDFAKFLQWQEDRREWQRFGKQQFARAYGDNEPEYTLADIREDSKA